METLTRSLRAFDPPAGVTIRDEPDTTILRATMLHETEEQQNDWKTYIEYVISKKELA